MADWDGRRPIDYLTELFCHEVRLGRNLKMSRGLRTDGDLTTGKHAVSRHLGTMLAEDMGELLRHFNA